MRYNPLGNYCRDSATRGAAAPFTPGDSPHIPARPKASKTAASKAASPKKPKLPPGKATKPELKPLDEHFAALPNPALNPEREAGAGFAEQAQEVADRIAARGLAGAVWAAEPGLYGVKISGHFRVPT